MQRRNFLKTGSMAAIAASLPASALLAKPFTCDPLNYKGSNTSDPIYDFNILMCPASIYDFEKTVEEDRKLDLSIDQADTQVYTASYKIVSVKLQKENSNAYDIVTERSSEVSNGTTPSGLDLKKLKFVFLFSADNPNSITLKDKKGNDYLKLEQEDLSAPADCFLTTACVDMMGKPDNCMELTTLRNFRDTMLADMDGGKELIEEYYSIAPGIVKAINDREERKQVYSGIYTEMILPVIDHIQNNQYSDAVNLYKNYTLELKTKYVAQVNYF